MTEAAETHRHAKPLFGWVSLTWLVLCVAVGMAMYAFLAASGQGWTHPKAASAQATACALLSCAPPPPIESALWHADELIQNGSNLQGTLTALSPQASQAPPIVLTLEDQQGIARLRELTPAQYHVTRTGDQLAVRIELASDTQTPYKTLKWRALPQPTGGNIDATLELAKHP